MKDTSGIAVGSWNNYLVLGLGGVLAVIILIIIARPKEDAEDLKEQILELSTKYVRQLRAEAADAHHYTGKFTDHDLKRTLAVVLEHVLDRLDIFEQKLNMVIEAKSKHSHDWHVDDPRMKSESQREKN